MLVQTQLVFTNEKPKDVTLFLMDLKSKHKFKLPPENAIQYTTAVKRIIRRNCCDKLKFRYKPEVIRRVMSMFDARPDSGMFTIYRCKFCGGWHFSSHSSMGYTNEQIDERTRSLHGQKRKRIRKRCIDANHAIEKLRNLGFLGNKVEAIHRPAKHRLEVSNLNFF